jgi:hypothetical protein
LALAAALVIGSGATFANSLSQTPPITGSQFGSQQDCTWSGWHFIHTGTGSTDLPATITVQFQNAGTVQASGYVNGNSIVQYNVLVSPSDTLLSASDSISNDGNLNLSHICNGSATPTPATPTPATPTPATPTPATPTPATPTPATPTPATPTPVDTATPFSSFQGDTATPADTSTPFESFQGDTAPPTGTTGGGSDGGSTPIFALLFSGIFGTIGFVVARRQRAAVRG